MLILVGHTSALWYDVRCVFFFKQKTAYEMRISDWSSDVCSSDLMMARPRPLFLEHPYDAQREIRLEAAGPRRVAFLDLMRRSDGHGGRSSLNIRYKIRPDGACR